jgi:acyl-CoA dehydrogenase
MIIYGQGAIRCHPFVQHEMRGVADRNVEKLDVAFFGHVNFDLKNMTRAFALGLTGSRLVSSVAEGKTAGYFRHFTRVSSAFALVSDFAMATLGGGLKRREKISGRLADILAWMYIASGALKKFYDEGQQERDLPLIQWSCEHALFQIQTAFLGVLDNFPNRPVALLLRLLVFPWGPVQTPERPSRGGGGPQPPRRSGGERLHLTPDIFIPRPPSWVSWASRRGARHGGGGPGRRDQEFDAVRAGKLDKAPGNLLAKNALKAGVISDAEYRKIKAAEEIRDEVIQVDAFEMEEFKRLRS